MMRYLLPRRQRRDKLYLHARVDDLDPRYDIEWEPNEVRREAEAPAVARESANLLFEALVRGMKSGFPPVHRVADIPFHSPSAAEQPDTVQSVSGK